jgi:hypothetical protein
VSGSYCLAAVNSRTPSERSLRASIGAHTRWAQTRYFRWMSTSMDGEDAIVFCIMNRETGVCGYTWFIEPHRTSFYIKSIYRPLQTMKVSIHGPDPNHVGKQHFRFDFTSPREAQKAINAGGGWAPFGDPMPWYFTGRPVNKRTVHLARFSAERNMFRRGMQRGPDPESKSKATLNAVVGAPLECP